MRHNPTLLAHPGVTLFVALAFLGCGIGVAWAFTLLNRSLVWDEAAAVVVNPADRTVLAWVARLAGRPWWALACGLGVGSLFALMQKRRLMRYVHHCAAYFVPPTSALRRRAVHGHLVWVFGPALMALPVCLVLGVALNLSVVLCVVGAFVSCGLLYPEQRAVHEAVVRRLAREGGGAAASSRAFALKLGLASLFMVSAFCALGYRIAGVLPLTQNVQQLMFAVAGTTLSAEDAGGLEERLAADPNDMRSRAKLLGYYFLPALSDEKAREARQQHVLWVIEHCPASPIAGKHFAHLYPRLGGRKYDGEDAYEAGKALWLRNVESMGGNVSVLGNAASYLANQDPAMAAELLERAQRLEPDNPEWAGRLRQLRPAKSDAQSMRV